MEERRVCRDCGEAKYLSAFPSIKHYQCRECKAAVERARRSSAGYMPPYVSPEKVSWKNMLTRVRNENTTEYHRYGGRGITVCDRWDPRKGGSFENFLSDMGPKPEGDYSIERRDNDGNYEPSNCHWATRSEQCSNTSRNIKVEMPDGRALTLMQISEETGINFGTLCTRYHENGYRGAELVQPLKHKVKYEYEGKSLTLKEWSAALGVTYNCLWKRIFVIGWTLEKALSTRL